MVNVIDIDINYKNYGKIGYDSNILRSILHGAFVLRHITLLK